MSKDATAFTGLEAGISPLAPLFRAGLVLICGLGSAIPVRAQTDPPKRDLGSLDLDQLMTIQVTTASKHAQTLSDVPSAIYVVTQDAIRRSGANNVPEALRGVPGVQVSQIDASKYVVSIRGMGGRYADKLLVLIDGRSIYTSLFSGVYWDVHDIDLDLVDRIEVIRGPGGSLWGANAVNGIINIITKSSKETLGTKLSVRSSTTDPYTVAVSSGYVVPKGTLRISAKGSRSSALETDEATPGFDNWSDSRVGLRGDWDLGGNSLSLAADANQSRQGQTTNYPTYAAPYVQLTGTRYDTSDWNFQGKWEKTEGVYKGTSLHFSFDHYDRATSDIAERDTNVAFDLQRPIQFGPRLHVIWGAEYKSDQNTVFKNPQIFALSPSMVLTTFGGFLQSEYNLSDRAKVSAGSKFEHNSFTGWEIQPSAHITYDAGKTNTFWASSSRAVRTPSMVDVDANLIVTTGPGPGGLAAAYHILGNPDFQSEVVLAQEVGWRYSPTSGSFIDVAAFYNQYSKLRDAVVVSESASMSPVPHLDVDTLFSNGGSAETGGIEVAAHQTLAPRLKVDESYSLYTEQYNLGKGNVLSPDGLYKGSTPRHQATFRANWEPARKLQINGAAYYTDSLVAQSVPSQVRLDLMGSWSPNPKTEFSVGVQNLTSAGHREAVVILYDTASQIPRSLFAKITLKF
jgi:iron complex outermembrane receptor protein